MDGEPIVAPTVRRNPSIKRLLKFPWGGQERLHTSSIVRQPSDRRPDAGNQALRSNGTAATSADSTDDVQLRLPSSGAYPAGGPGETGAGIVGKGATGRGARESNVPSSGDATGDLGGTAAAETSAQDAAEGKDARRERLHQHHQNKSAPVSVNRSESYKERLSQKRNRNSRRKTSDPSLTSRPNDEQADVGLSNSNFTASSNSSLSSGGGSESPSTSMEQMGGAGGATATATGHPITHHHSMHAHHTTPHHHMHQHSHQDSFHGSIGGGSMNTSFWGSSFGGVGSGQPGQRQWNFESDEEDDLNEADWSSNVTAELLAALTDAEKKRQEIINEIYQTERSHVRILKLLERLFLLPLQDSSLLTAEHLTLLFPPALLSLREIHTTFEQQLKQRRVEHNHVVTHIGDLLSGMFFGKSGDDLCQYAQQFCARQQIALEALKEKRRKDEQLQKLLTKAESHKACRRLQLKDLLPAVLQRLTKYPLLFENLYKVTIRVVPDDVSEAEAIRCALESSKKILVDVNQAVKTAEDTHKLQNIQRKLDKSTFDKDEFKNLDLTQYRLIHDGSLTMKKNPSIQLHGLLFEDMIVLLTKQDDKYSLKYLHAPRNTEVNNKPVNPIMSIDSETLVRQEAADKNSFFLIKTKTSQMLELRAPSSSECKTWFKHISDAAEQYKPRSKNANHEPVDDPAIATIPHSNTKESLELTPERPQPASAIATVTTTPLAPMMPVATATSVNVNNNNNNDHHNVQLRNGRRESISTAGSADHKMRLSHNELSPSIGSSSAAISSASTASLSSSSAAVNRTMSTRSCGEPNNNNGGYENASVTLRHTQSARQANGHNAGVGADEFGSSASGAGIGSGSKRDSASIVYSNNSNNTRTLMQSSPPLVEPTAIQISISPAHTAEPVLTPAERLRRLDVSIRDGLLEKQKIICDMFRLPVEHFHEIVDIAAMPEAPKDSADIALAAYAQVQSLTEVLNEYMHVTPEQEISAVSTAVCDQCHEKQQQHHHHHSQRPLTAASSNSSSTSTMNSTGSSTTTQIAANGSVSAADIPPPLPPPNKQIAQQQTPTAKTATSVRTVLQNALMDEDIHEDDDGYCEIDELRLPALPPTLASKTPKSSSPPPPLPPPAGSFKAPPLPPPPAAIQQQQQQLQQQNQQEEEKSASNATIVNTTLPEETATTVVTQTGMAELVKRQSTISADSIPEESADEVTQALNEGHVGEPATAEQLDAKHKAETVNTKEDESAQPQTGEKVKTEAEQDKVKLEVNEEQTSESKVAEDATETATTAATIGSVSTTDMAAVGTVGAAEPQSEPSATEKSAESEDKTAAVESTTVCDDKEAATTATVTTTATATAETTSTNDTNTHDDEEHMEVNDAYETLSTLSSKLNSALAMVDHSTQTTPIALSLNTLATSTANTNTSSSTPVHCGPNRIQHANSLEPSVPCHALNAIVSSLNSQISLLLPKINERDMERERLRKENQHLRELLNAMHERQRVEAKLETPTDATAVISSSGDAATADEIDGTNNTNSTTPQMQSNSATTDVTAAAATSATTSVTLEGVSSEATNIAVNNTTTTTVAADTTKATTTSAECDN
uniref:Rho guanine nucleotide exchange factor 1 n=1 Tax=Bactrocera dorsalis TaxID=27457 RepID=A0A034V4R1_BACDO